MCVTRVHRYFEKNVRETARYLRNAARQRKMYPSANCHLLESNSITKCSTHRTGQIDHLQIDQMYHVQIDQIDHLKIDQIDHLQIYEIDHLQIDRSSTDRSNRSSTDRSNRSSTDISAKSTTDRSDKSSHVAPNLLLRGVA